MVYEHIRALREDKDLSQKQIANMLGIAQTTYSGYETGAHDYPSAVLIQLADFYKTSVDYLLGRTNDMTPPKKL
ncbi:helix-turn-helix domain-containing protein [Agathobaculum sp.]|uniref:helix-turn-helix domain-containing protein n=1 Tax=Agathobaculum sp. TaxID=2048138 RepID=UPI002A816DCE|nr:helix-turn-helix transcriptional regulator [Agathobaculum sp.]MDY3619395.1 helix-turn-helix transcriptional regulator [Agathobaculum sp.]